MGAAIGIGATAGVAAYEDRGIEQAARDKKTELQIMGKWLDHPASLAVDLSVEVYENRAMLTGRVDKPDEMADAIRLAWEVASVKEVINEIQVDEGGGFLDSAKDTWITTQLRTTITADRAIYAINYSIETVDGVVYLIGIGQSAGEVDRVVNHAREISGVRKVISHVRVKSSS